MGFLTYWNLGAVMCAKSRGSIWRSGSGPRWDGGFWERVAETGAGGGRHRLPIVFWTGFAPFAWRTGVTSPRHVCRGGVSCSHGPSREGVSPGSDQGRPVSWLTDPSRRVSTRHPRRAIRSPRLRLLVPLAFHSVRGRGLAGRFFMGVRVGRWREARA